MERSVTGHREAWLPAVVPSLAEWLEDAAHVLTIRYDYLDPDAEEYPPSVLAKLAELAEAGPCEDCPGWPNPDVLAQHFVTRKLQEWERSLPTWTCDCGAVYKPVTEWGATRYWHARPDGLLGDVVGDVRTNSKGKVKHSGACPCGRSFAETVARQTAPQQSLF
jgi:hypothetical protein